MFKVDGGTSAERAPAKRCTSRVPPVPSETVFDQALQAEAVPTAAGKFLAILEHHDVFPTVHRLQFFDLVHVHDSRAVNSNELRRIEFIGNVTDPFAQQIRLIPGIKLDVVGGGFNPVNFLEVEEYNSSAGLKHEASVLRRRG